MRRNSRRIALALILLLTTLGFIPSSRAADTAPTDFSISFSNSQSEEPVDGRLLLLLSSDPSAEPRMQIDDSVRTQMMFGMDVEGMKPGQSVMLDDSASGYPISSLRDVPPGEYYVQAVLHRYETFHRSDGHTVKLPMDRGEGQHWNLAPGNLYSTPQKITLGSFEPTGFNRARQGNPAHPAAAGHQIHPPSQDSKRAAHKVLGTPHVSQRQRAGAGRIRCASQRSLSTSSSLKTTSMPTSAASAPSRPIQDLKPDYSERFHSRGLQPHPARRGLQVLPAVDCAGIPARRDRGNQPRQSLL